MNHLAVPTTTRADRDREIEFQRTTARTWQARIRAGCSESIQVLRGILVSAEDGVKVRAAEILMRAGGLLRNRVDADAAEQVRDALRGLMLRDAREEEKPCVTVDARVTAPPGPSSASGVGGDTRSRTSNDDPLTPSPNLRGPGPNVAVENATASGHAGEAKAEGVGSKPNCVGVGGVTHSQGGDDDEGGDGRDERGDGGVVRGAEEAVAGVDVGDGVASEGDGDGGGGDGGEDEGGVEELRVHIVEVDGCGEVVEGPARDVRRGKYFNVGAVDAGEEKGAVEEREYREAMEKLKGMGEGRMKSAVRGLQAAMGIKKKRRGS